MNQLQQPIIRMYTTTWCPDCFRAKKVLETMKVPYEEINITNNEEAIALVIKLNHGNQSVPTILFPDGTVLTEPSITVLMQKLQGISVDK